MKAICAHDSTLVSSALTLGQGTVSFNSTGAQIFCDPASGGAAVPVGS